MTLLRELIPIPEAVHKGDFVLKLTEGVRDGASTLRNYVVTKQLLVAFREALKLVQAAIEGNTSKAAFLHGSFGSGKSHFMAVLHLLLSQDRGARAHADLAPLVAEHGWLNGKKFLLVPFHMLGAKSLEHAIFSQYIEYVSKHHPQAPVPPVFLGERILEQAEVERRRGDAEFFARLGGSGGDWGDLDAWDLQRYQQARKASPNDPERLALISAIVTHFLPAYHQAVGADGSEGYVSLDLGLPILCKHAKELGFDGLVLFLDEVILWLATMSANQDLVNREAAKLAKLVESQGEARAIPIVSVLARQRDLRELVGDHVPGAQKLGFLDIVNYGGGRFEEIRLEDRNLPEIVEKRLLRPRDEAARAKLDDAFAKTIAMRREIRETLLTGQFNQEDFRRVYPFSPAFIQTLVAVSSVLQRERTAIKVLMQLLSSQRDVLEVGQVVPLGDLFDAIAEGDEPFTVEMRQHFENAKKIYQQKLRPRLLLPHGLSEDAMEALPDTDLRRKAFRNDDRLVKTLLLAALVPEVAVLKSMTAARLVALNHGTIYSPIPGEEVRLVLQKLKDWSADVGELKLQGDPANPTISLAIIGVDTDGIIQRARQSADNAGNRKIKVRELLYEELGIEVQDRLWSDYQATWRGTRRSVQVVYGNVRELPAESLRANGSEWRLVIDYPFDDGHGPEDDLKRLEDFRQRESARTVCWIPAFFSQARMSDLGLLVALDHVLQSPQRFEDHANHLPAVERPQAKSLLQSQQSMLRVRMVQALEMAYGVHVEQAGTIGQSIDAADRFQCLHASQSTMQPPVAANLKGALEKLVDQMLQLEFPKHPNFEVGITPATVKRVFEWVQKAARDPMHRVVVERDRRREVKAVVEPLELGSMGEDALVLGEYWRTHFDRQSAFQPNEPITVGRLRAWTDRPEARGLPAELQNLLIHTYAELTSRRFFQHGGNVQVTIDSRLDDALELREQLLPSETHWKAAVERANHVFGVVVGSVLSATNVGELVTKVKSEITPRLAEVRELVRELDKRCRELQIDKEPCPRLLTASAVQAICDALARTTEDLFVERLATAEITGTQQAMGASFKQAGAVRAALQQADWTNLATAWELEGDEQAAAKAIRDQVVEGLRHDELTEPLAACLRARENEASQLVRKALQKRQPPAGAPPATQVPPAPLPAAPTPGRQVVEEGHREGLGPRELEALLLDLASKVKQGKRVVRLQWRIDEERGTA